MMASQVLPLGVSPIEPNTCSRRSTCLSVSPWCFSKAALQLRRLRGLGHLRQGAERSSSRRSRCLSACRETGPSVFVLRHFGLHCRCSASCCLSSNSCIHGHQWSAKSKVPNNQNLFRLHRCCVGARTLHAQRLLGTTASAQAFPSRAWPSREEAQIDNLAAAGIRGRDERRARFGVVLIAGGILFWAIGFGEMRRKTAASRPVPQALPATSKCG